MELLQAYQKHRELFPNSRFNKNAVRSSYLELCAWAGLKGSSFWLSGDSTEILDYLSLTGADPSTVWNCEVDPQLHTRLFDFYRTELGCMMAPRNYRLHQMIALIEDPIVYGHADFIGNVGSNHQNKTHPAPFTFEVIDSLVGRLAEKSILSFTHTRDLRAATRIRPRLDGVRERFNEEYNPATPFSRNYHPTFMVGLYLALIFCPTHNIDLVATRDYPSTHSGTKQPNKKMSKCTFTLREGEFDKARFVDQMNELPTITNERQ